MVSDKDEIEGILLKGDNIVKGQDNLFMINTCSQDYLMQFQGRTPSTETTDQLPQIVNNISFANSNDFIEEEVKEQADLNRLVYEENNDKDKGTDEVHK